MADQQLFKKLVAFSDIHFGYKGDSKQHNQDCEDFVSWFIEESKNFGAETCIFLGDWHHNRARTNVSTMNYSLRNIERLGKAFKKFFFITGNHDLYYRDKRELNSMEFSRNVDNVNIVSKPLNRDGVAIIPWLVGDEWKKIGRIKCKYMFGHFELPQFKMNAMVNMPETGQLHAEDFIHPEYIFSGHFHKRQIQEKMIYIGNPFPHNYSDAWDDDRGMMFLEWDKEPFFKSWEGAPKYRKLILSELLENPKACLDSNTYARIEMDISPTYEEISYIKEIIMDEYNPRDITLMPTQQDEYTEDFGGELNFESVDSLVLSHLASIESNSIDNELLARIYNTL